MLPLILTFVFDINLGRFGLLGAQMGSKTALGSTHVIEQLLFSIVPSILTFYFDFILGLFLAFLGPKWANFGSQGKVQKLFLDVLM